MFRVTLQSLLAHKIRFTLTTSAVVLGVSFVVASFVLTDGLRATFDNIVVDASEGVDAEVRARTEFDESDFVATTFSDDVVEIVASVDGVAEAVPNASSGSIVPVTSTGAAVETMGAPIISANWRA